MTRLTCSSKAYSSFLSVGILTILIVGLLAVSFDFGLRVADQYGWLVVSLAGALGLFAGLLLYSQAKAVKKRRLALRNGVETTARVISLVPKYASVGVCTLEIQGDISGDRIVKDEFISTLYARLKVNQIVSIKYLPNDPNIFVITDL